MGSLLYERGVLHTRSYDELNLVAARADPHGPRATTSHAGAEVIETNTFGANRIALARHGLAEQVAAINRAARRARARGGRRARVRRRRGRARPASSSAIATAAERRLARFALAEQIDTLVLAGVDAIVLETFTSILEMEDAIHVAQASAARKVPVIAMMVFDARRPQRRRPRRPPRSPIA